MAGILDRYRREPSGLWLPRTFGMAGTAYGWCQDCCGGSASFCDDPFFSVWAEYIQITVGEVNCTGVWDLQQFDGGTFQLQAEVDQGIGWVYALGGSSSIRADLTCNPTNETYNFTADLRFYSEYPSYPIRAGWISAEFPDQPDLTSFSITCDLYTYHNCNEVDFPTSVTVESLPP